jgi:hypothetical protein
MTIKELFDGATGSSLALSIVRPQDVQIFFTPDGVAPVTFPALSPELAEPSPQLTAISPGPSLEDLFNCGVNFFAPGFNHCAQNCIYFIDA